MITPACLLEFSYFNKNYKMIAIDLSKQQVLDADPRASNTTMFFIIEEAKQNCF